LNTPKLNLNQRKINEKQTFKRLGQSDISQVFEVDDILGTPQAIKGFDKSDFCEVFSIFSLTNLPKSIFNILLSKQIA
jgi:hypothetical protein